MLVGRVISSIDDSRKQSFANLDTPVNNTNSLNFAIRLFCLNAVPRGVIAPSGLCFVEIVY